MKVNVGEGTMPSPIHIWRLRALQRCRSISVPSARAKTTRTSAGAFGEGPVARKG